MTVEESENGNSEPTPEEVLPEGISSQSAVTSWLANNGVLLEMKVASDFRRHLTTIPFKDISHGRIYLDEESGEKLRESDVVVHVDLILNSNISLVLWLIIECKSSLKGKWVFYRSDDLTHYSEKYNDLFLTRSTDDFNFQSLGGLSSIPIFDLAHKPFSYSVVTAFTGENENKDKRNLARDAILQVLSATKGVSLDSILPQDRKAAAVFLPMVVTKSEMFSARLLDTGEISVEPTYRELVINRYKSLDGTLDAIWVIHESQIEAVIQEFASELRNFFYN